MQMPFHWIGAATVKIAAGTSGNDRAALLKAPMGRFQLRFYNAGTVPVFIRRGVDNTVTASAAGTDMCIAPGSVEVLTVESTDKTPVTHIAAVVASGTADLYITTGSGI